MALVGCVENDFESLHEIEYIALGVVNVEAVDELLPFEVVEQHVERVVQLLDVNGERAATGAQRVRARLERSALQIGAHSQTPQNHREISHQALGTEHGQCLLLKTEMQCDSCVKPVERRVMLS